MSIILIDQIFVYTAATELTQITVVPTNGKLSDPVKSDHDAIASGFCHGITYLDYGRNRIQRGKCDDTWTRMSLWSYSKTSLAKLSFIRSCSHSTENERGPWDTLAGR